MDIKGVFRQVIPFAAGKTEEAKARQKTDADNDREGNGQAAGGGEQQKRRQYTPDEIQEVVKHLEGLQGMKDNNLTVRAETKDDVTVIYVQDRDGKIIRRIPESEFQALMMIRQKKTGQLLNKAM